MTGTVNDETGAPLPGATVIVEGTSRGVATDFDGNFSINAEEGEVLVVTYVGYSDYRLTVDSQDNYNISLSADNELEEVVVTSLGIQREKQALGYAISEVDEASIEQRAEGDIGRGQDKTVTLFFGNEPDFASGVTPDHAGRAYSVCNDEAVSFEIIQSYWEDYTIVQRLYVFYHEAGHARYNYRHPCEFDEVCNVNTDNLPIMWASAFAGNNNNFEEFIKDKNDFFARRWEGIRYFNCTNN